MNERIQQLAEQVGMKECSLGYGMPENVLWGENQIKEFAQLIVQECCDLMQGFTFEEIATKVIKKNFGVEE